MTALELSFVKHNFHAAVLDAYPFHFVEGSGNIYTHELVNWINHMFPAATSMSELENYWHAQQVGFV